jgi:hypothetical protein
MEKSYEIYGIPNQTIHAFLIRNPISLTGKRDSSIFLSSEIFSFAIGFSSKNRSRCFAGTVSKKLSSLIMKRAESINLKET